MMCQTPIVKHHAHAQDSLSEIFPCFNFLLFYFNSFIIIIIIYFEFRAYKYSTSFHFGEHLKIRKKKKKTKIVQQVFLQ